MIFSAFWLSFMHTHVNKTTVESAFHSPHEEPLMGFNLPLFVVLSYPVVMIIFIIHSWIWSWQARWRCRFLQTALGRGEAFSWLISAPKTGFVIRLLLCNMLCTSMPALSLLSCVSVCSPPPSPPQPTSTQFLPSMHHSSFRWRVWGKKCVQMATLLGGSVSLFLLEWVFEKHSGVHWSWMDTMNRSR